MPKHNAPACQRIAVEEASLPQKAVAGNEIAEADNRRIVSLGEERLSGTDRMMCAMGCQWQYVTEERVIVGDMPVAPEVLSAFSDDNARRVFNIG